MALTIHAIKSSEERHMEERLHWPDHRFVDYCFKQYGLNRGIYNTVDEWLYDNGITGIVERRRTIIRFLAYIQPQENQAGRFLKFGKGGLIKKLEPFIAALKREGGAV